MAWEHVKSVWVHRGTTASNQLAAFDLDSTLIYPDDGRSYATKGFVFAYDQVAETLATLAEEGWTLVIFSNRYGPATPTLRLAEQLLKRLSVNPWIFFATRRDEFRKPEGGMFRLFLELSGLKPDLVNSFYTGDAVGPTAIVPWFQWAESDRLFAEGVGLPFRTPLEVFPEFPLPVLKASTRGLITVGFGGWEVFEPYLGMTLETYFVTDGSVLPPEGMIVLVFGALRLEKERLALLQRLGLRPDEVEYLAYFRPRGESKPLTVEWPATYLRMT